MALVSVELVHGWRARGETLQKTYEGTADSTIGPTIAVPGGTRLQRIPLAVTKALVQQFFLSSSQPVTVYFNGTNEVQTVTISGSPTGGTFTLTYSGQTTAGIAYNASAATVQAALIALSNIDTGDVVVTGSAGGPYTVTFGGLLGLTNVPAMTASAAGLTGGTPSIAIATPTPGVAPDATWTLGANSPQVWDVNGIFTNPMPVDLVAFYVTNLGTVSARFEARFGVNVS